MTFDSNPPPSTHADMFRAPKHLPYDDESLFIRFYMFMIAGYRLQSWGTVCSRRYRLRSQSTVCGRRVLFAVAEYCFHTKEHVGVTIGPFEALSQCSSGWIHGNWFTVVLVVEKERGT
jgi:hypothetical protein